MSKKRNLLGKRFGRLLVIGEDINNKKGTYWKCRCVCGKEKSVYCSNLKKRTVSCGCYKSENLSKRNKKHEMSNTKQWRVWCSMKSRCFNKNNKAYKWYGGRGIKVCDRWLEGFENFWKDMKNGYEEGLTLDRIDNNGNYCKENCRWVSFIEQNNNRRNNRMVKIGKETKTVAEWSREYNLNYQSVCTRISRGWDEELAITTRF